MRNVIILIRICGKATPQHEKVIYYAKYYFIWDYKTKTSETKYIFFNATLYPSVYLLKYEIEKERKT